jgi:hypothetical protein
MPRFDTGLYQDAMGRLSDYVKQKLSPEVVEQITSDVDRNIFGGKVTLPKIVRFGQSLIGKTPQDQMTNFVTPVGMPIGYHGTLSPKWFEQKSYKSLGSWNMLDKMIGPHFAKDPQVANKFAEGLYRIDKSHLYDEFGNPSIWGKPLIPQGGNVRRAFIPDELYKVPQPKYESSAMMSDQYAIGQDIGRQVFPERKDLFINWFTRARNSTEKSASDVWDRLKSGEPVTINKTKYSNVGDIVAEYDPGLHMLSEDLRDSVVNHYKEVMKRKGYKGVQYTNTAPSEVLKGENPETYIPFDIEDIKSQWGGKSVIPDYIPFKSGNSIVEVYKNPSQADFIKINKKYREQYPNAPVGSVKSRVTKDMEGNSYRWMSGESTHDAVEEYLRKNFGIETNQNY